MSLSFVHIILGIFKNQTQKDGESRGRNQRKIIFLKVLIFPLKKKKSTTALRHNLSFKLFFQLTMSLKFPCPEASESVFKINKEIFLNDVCGHPSLMSLSTCSRTT